MKFKIMIMGLLIIFLIGCVTLPDPIQFEGSFGGENTFNDVWVATVETLSEFNFSIINLDKESGIITTGWREFSVKQGDAYCVCQSWGYIVPSGIFCKLNVFLKASSDGSCELKINSTFEKHWANLIKGKDAYTTKCGSIGVLEKELSDSINSKLISKYESQY